MTIIRFLADEGNIAVDNVANLYHLVEQGVPPSGTGCATWWNGVYHPMERGVPSNGTGCATWWNY